jgi:sensor c-di-GMP phosphodiesterase-like protein
VNLSARQFGDRGFLDMVTRVLNETGLRPQCLELEITESQVMRQTEGIIQLLNKLAEMGVSLAIDDFGTGYSSLSYLKRLPIQKLKIDQSFIRDVTVDPNDAAIVVAIISMASSLDLETIARGVETEGSSTCCGQRAAARGRASTSRGRCRRASSIRCCARTTRVPRQRPRRAAGRSPGACRSWPRAASTPRPYP